MLVAPGGSGPRWKRGIGMIGRRGAGRACALAIGAALVGTTLTACTGDGDRSPSSVPTDHSASAPDAEATVLTLALGRGDRLAVSLPDEHQVTVQHYSASEDGWSPPVEVAADGLADRECGDVEGIASGGTVALILECDESYYAETPPTMSIAAVSSDLVHWDTRDLEGEASGRPGLSPSGEYAGWLEGAGDLVSWHDGDFATEDAPDGAGELGVADDGSPILLSARRSAGECVVRFVGADGATDVDTGLDAREDGCEVASWISPDEVVFWGFRIAERGYLFRNADGDWAVGHRAPSDADGLADYGEAAALPPVEVVTAAGERLAIGSPDGAALVVQTYDDPQGWQDLIEIGPLPDGACRWNGAQPPDTGVVVLEMTCDGQQLAIVGTDADDWSVDDLGAATVWRSPLATAVLVPSGEPLVVTPSGARRVGPVRPCDGFVVGDDASVFRFTGTAESRGWPAVVDRSDGDDWRAVDTKVRFRVPRTRCGSSYPAVMLDGDPVLGFTARVAATDDRRATRFLLVDGTLPDADVTPMVM